MSARQPSSPTPAPENVYTRGPWRVVGTEIQGPALDCWNLKGHGGMARAAAFIVAHVPNGEGRNYMHYPRAIAEANARVIREAPNMVEALRACVEIIEGFDENREEDEPSLPDVVSARAILARIDGATP